MKKTLGILLCAAILICMFAGCSAGNSSENGVVNVYNWGEYIDESLLSQFEEETGIELNYKTFETNEQMYSIFKQGGVSYDVIIPSDYMISRMIGEDMLEPLDFNNIPNFSLIDESLKNPEYDPGNLYSIPYTWGTVGIIYDPAVVGEVTSWSALFDEENADQVLMFDNPRDAMAIALKFLGYSVNTTALNELNEAYELLLEQKPILQGYVMDQIYDKLEGGEAAIGPYYAGDYLVMLETNPDLKFCIPNEGSNIFVDAMCIPKGAKNKANAEAFIDFFCRTDNSLKNAESIGYTSPNIEVRARLDLDEYSESVMYPSPEILEKLEAFVNLPQETLNYYDEIWVKLKS